MHVDAIGVPGTAVVLDNLGRRRSAVVMYRDVGVRVGQQECFELLRVADRCEFSCGVNHSYVVIPRGKDENCGLEIGQLIDLRPKQLTDQPRHVFRVH